MVRFLLRFFLIPTSLFVLWCVGLGVFIWTIPQYVLDDQANAQAIVVLTGGRERLKTGFQLLKAKRAERIFISGVHSEETLKSLFKLLKVSHVITPEEQKNLEALTFIGYKAHNTKENAQETAEWIKQQKITSFILVTAAYHMPRSLLELRTALPHTTIIAHPVFPQEFDRSHWWWNKHIFLLIVSEYNKYLWSLIRNIFS